MLDIGDSGIAADLKVGDSFVFVGNKNGKKIHLVTNDLDSHFEYDHRPNKILSKDTAVTRVGEKDPNEDTKYYSEKLTAALSQIEKDGRIETFIVDAEKALNYLAAIPDGTKVSDRLLEVCIDIFSDVQRRHGKKAIECVDAKKTKEYNFLKNQAMKILDNNLQEKIIREVISEIIKKCGSKWCLYSKKTGKTLGTHDTKGDAEKQEIAIAISKAKHGK